MDVEALGTGVKDIVIDSPEEASNVSRELGRRSDWSSCCNAECMEKENLFRPNTTALTFFGLKYSRSKHYRICDLCFNRSQEHFATLQSEIWNNKPLVSVEYPKPGDTVILDDSDEEKGEPSDEELGLNEASAEKFAGEYWSIFESTVSKLDLPFQMIQGTAILTEMINSKEKTVKELEAEIDKVQVILDRGRRDFYNSCTAPAKETQPIDIIDAVLTNHAGVATKKVTPISRWPPRSPKYESSQDVVAVEEIKVDKKPLPPEGPVQRPRPAPGEIVYVMKYGFHGVWTQAKVVEHVQRFEDGALQKLYKIRYEYRKSSYLKVVPGKHLAYSKPSKVRLPVGTRVIALFKEEGSKENYYAGLTAEPPKTVNKYRYLVFFDDGYAQYIPHEKILVVCEESRCVWEDMHPESRAFIRNYLEQYPERPMVKLQVEQIVKTEWNGKWWVARVQEVDCSLVKMRFDADNRTEWIYRGSARLSPLFVELSHARRIPGSDNLRRHRGLGTASLKKRNMPYVEYTRNEMDDNKPDSFGKVEEGQSTQAPRAVARKSTTRQSDTISDDGSGGRVYKTEPEFGRIEYLKLDTKYKPRYFRPHQCSPNCIAWVPYDPEALKGQNPLCIPLLCGWYREIVRCRGRRSISYRSPCGRRIRTMEELHRYLRSVKSKMGVDMFDFDFWVHCCAEFVLEKGFSEIKDLSYGLENVPVSCVNCVDHSVPDFVNYSTQRLPMEGVPLNLDPEFLTGCDCVDDCRDRSKCSCWQLTIGGTACVRGAEPDFTVGYQNKRLPEPVTTGIYECNSRCKCSNTCLNRVAQFPLQLKLQVFKTVRRGWGIRCLNDVPQGSFICVYAGRLLTEQGANEGGKNYGDEYLAELDYIEVVERMKEDYESDVAEDFDSDLGSPASMRFGSIMERDLTENEEGVSSSTEEEIENLDIHDSDEDFRPGSKESRLKQTSDGSISVSANGMPESRNTKRKKIQQEKTRLRNRRSNPQSSDDADQRKRLSEHTTKKVKCAMKPTSMMALHRAKFRPLEDDCITLSDDDESDGVRLPSSFTPGVYISEAEKQTRYRSVRELFGKDEFCYIMDAKNAGNIGRYLNHSCSPNVFVQNVFVDTHDLRFPWVAFFALTYIPAGTELTWDYNYDVGSVPGKVLHCHCGANDCRGRLL